MKCKSITVKKLFHTFDYQLSWPEEGNEYILLLTGPNGYGKTTLLKILYYLKEGQWYYFYKLPFHDILIEFDNETKLHVKEIADNNNDIIETNDEIVIPRRKLQFQLINGNIISSEFFFTENDAKIIEANPHTKRVHIEWDDEVETLQEILDYSIQNKHVYEFLAERAGYGTFSMFIEAININYIPANRLFKEEGGANVLSVKSISKELKNRLRRISYRYLNKVSEARSHVYENLLKGSTEYTKGDYDKIVDELKEKVRTMHKWGLIPYKEFIPYKEGKGAIFSVYLNEVKETLATYEEIYQKLETFASLLKKKNFVNKKIEYSPTRGLVVLSSTGKPIDIDCLSSGEQNEIVMLYTLIFQMTPNMILLIDEPENSLHVEWQSVYYEELEEICQANGIQAIVATHSPQIIGERWESCIDLYEQVEQQ